MDEWSYRFKLSVLGDAAVGKTALLKQFATGKFEPHIESTIGVETLFKVVELKGEDGEMKLIRIQLWDSSGDTRFRHLLRARYKDVRAVLLVYDITRYSTYLDLQQWNEEVTTHCKNNGDDVIRIIVGNKLDLADKREVDTDEVKRWAAEQGIFHMEVSAKDKNQVEACFMKAIKEVFSQIESEAPETPEIDPWCQILRVFCYLA